MTSPTRLGGEAAEHEGGRAPVRRRRDPEGGRADRGQTYGYRELKAGSGAQSGGADNGERDMGENGQGTPGGPGVHLGSDGPEEQAEPYQAQEDQRRGLSEASVALRTSGHGSP
jgi:hypothetical protein